MISKHSAPLFCNEDLSKIENYEEAVADTAQTWDLHHRLETHFSNGDLRPLNARLSKSELIALDMYYNRPANELIFMTHADHARLHKKDEKFTENHKRKISESIKKHWLTRDKSPERFATTRGRKWFTDGITDVMAYSCPIGYHAGRSKYRVKET